MTTSMRLAAAAAAAGLILAPGGAALAGSGHGSGHGSNHSGTHGGQGGTHGSAAVEHLQKQLLRQIERLGDRMDHATRESRLAPLAEEARAGVLANVAADQAALADLAALVDAATTRDELTDLRKQLRAVHPENYEITVASLRSAARLSARIVELRTTLAADPAALARLDEADALVASATDKALAVTAASSKSDVRAVRTDLDAAQQIVGEVDADADTR
ncbi:MAG: hypothetical protein WC642_13630 [Nocardioides sp.]|jgi:acetylornithine deacetylase/succinyl-diaminopimelate desuccinylase-like protein